MQSPLRLQVVRTHRIAIRTQPTQHLRRVRRNRVDCTNYTSMDNTDQLLALELKIRFKNNYFIFIYNDYLLFFNFNFILLNFKWIGSGARDLLVYADKLFIQFADRIDVFDFLDSDCLTIAATLHASDILHFTHNNAYTILMTPSSVSVYQNFILSSTAPSTNPHIPSLSPDSCYLAMSHLGSSTVLLQRTPSLSPFQSLPHLSPIRSLQWRDNSLLIVETSDNDLYAYIRSSPTKFDPWTIYVSPCLLRSFWLGPSTTDLLLRRALSDSNYLFHQNSPLSSLIATRRYESVSQISQFSRDLILNFSSDGYNLSINAINDTSHSTCNYIRSSPIVQLKLNEYIPNDITDIRLTCSSSHSPIYIIALRDANRGLLVGVLNPASIFDPVPDTNLHPPIHWLRNADHAQHTHAIRFITTDPLGQTLSTYSHQDGKLIHWHVVDTPSNAMHKLGILNSVASLDGLQDVYASIHVHNGVSLLHWHFTLHLHSQSIRNCISR